MSEDPMTHRQKKHSSALLKTQHQTSQQKSKRALEYSKDKGLMKQNRDKERNQKNDSFIENRQYYCNRCKVWSNIAKCYDCYVEWCGIDGDYEHCKFGIDDLCQSHISNYQNTHYENYYEYSYKLYEQECEDRITDMQSSSVLASDCCIA
jgi:hypothetical protein